MKVSILSSLAITPAGFIRLTTTPPPPPPSASSSPPPYTHTHTLSLSLSLSLSSSPPPAPHPLPTPTLLANTVATAVYDCRLSRGVRCSQRFESQSGGGLVEQFISDRRVIRDMKETELKILTDGHREFKALSRCFANFRDCESPPFFFVSFFFFKYFISWIHPRWPRWFQ